MGGQSAFAFIGGGSATTAPQQDTKPSVPNQMPFTGAGVNATPLAAPTAYAAPSPQGIFGFGQPQPVPYMHQYQPSQPMQSAQIQHMQPFPHMHQMQQMPFPAQAQQMQCSQQQPMAAAPAPLHSFDPFAPICVRA